MEKKLVAWSGAFMASLMLAQPLLDVVSYFMAGVGHTGLTTALRCLLLVVVGAYGFAISEHKPVYMGVYGVLAAFWLLHALNCLRQGYADPVGDLAEYLKLIQFPLWTLSFVTFFRRREELQGNGPVFLAVNFGIIVAVILLSYATGTPVYTYFTPERGVVCRARRPKRHCVPGGNRPAAVGLPYRKAAGVLPVLRAGLCPAVFHRHQAGLLRSPAGGRGLCCVDFA